jgi:hypothetical protein
MKLILTPSHPRLALVLVDLETARITRIECTPDQSAVRSSRRGSPHRPFGITWDRETLYITNRRHLLAFDRALTYRGIVHDRLGDNPHQAVWRAGTLYVVSPSLDGILMIDGPPFGEPRLFEPHTASWPVASAQRVDRHHYNSLVLSRATAYVLSHNMRREPSEVLTFALPSWTPAQRVGPLGWSAHNLCVGADGVTTLDTDGTGCLLRSDGVSIPLTDRRHQFLRGLAVSDEFYFVGVSPRTERVYRGAGTSVIKVVSRKTQRVVGEIPLTDIGAINDMRLLDAFDHGHCVPAFWPAGDEPVKLFSR